MVRVFRLFALPDVLAPDSLYLIADAATPGFVREIYTGVDGLPREPMPFDVSGSDGLSMVGRELRIDIDALPSASGV